MDLKLTERVALITGASSGLGRACALALAAEGAKLALAARRADELARVVDEAKALGANQARSFIVDLADPASIAKLHEEVRASYEAVDILIANGGGPPAGSYTAVAPQAWDEAYRLVFTSVRLLIDGVLPSMRKRKWGRIVALESSSVKEPIANLVLSNAFRTAVVAALKTLSREVAADGVTINCIATGRIDTDRLRSLYAGNDAGWEAAAKEIPAGRFATPEEFAPLVAFLAGEPAKYVTGQTIAIDGGLTRSLL